MTDMPKEIWVYNRDGRLEARDCAIVVGNESYTLTSETIDALIRRVPALHGVWFWRKSDNSGWICDIDNRGGKDRYTGEDPDPATAIKAALEQLEEGAK